MGLLLHQELVLVVEPLTRDNPDAADVLARAICRLQHVEACFWRNGETCEALTKPMEATNETTTT